MMYLIQKSSGSQEVTAWRMCAHQIPNAELKLNSRGASEWTATMKPAKITPSRFEMMKNSQMGRDIEAAW